jgi:hypothetical protein
MLLGCTGFQVLANGMDASSPPGFGAAGFVVDSSEILRLAPCFPDAPEMRQVIRVWRACAIAFMVCTTFQRSSSIKVDQSGFSRLEQG